MPNRPASTSAASRFASRRTLGTTLALVALAALAPQPRPAFAQAFSVGLRLDYAVGANPSAMKVGDLNGDGKLDIVVANQNDNTVSVLLGNGAGSFAAQPTLAAGTAPSSLAIADLNGDGRTDLVVTNRGVHPTWGNTVSVLMGNGDGTFQSRTPFETGTWPASVAIGGLNGDGKPDLVVVNNGYNYSDSTVSVLMGNGNGTFQSQTRFVTGRGPYSLSIGDLNSDGKPDLMVANRGVTGSPLTATSLMGNGDGTFQPPTLVQSVFTQIRFEGSMAIGDVNGDGKLDLVWGSSYSYLGNDVYRIRVSFGTGAGGFGGGGEINPPGNDSYPSVLVIADMNGDGYPDVVAERGNAAVYFGNGDGTFSAAWPQIIEIGGGAGVVSVAVGDMNGDGKPDLVTADASTNKVSVFLTSPAGLAFAPTANVKVGTQPWGVAVGNLNGDGHPDIALNNAGSAAVTVLLNNGSGGFPTGTNFTTGGTGGSVAIGDLNGDGHSDLVTSSQTAHTLSVFLNNSTGTGAFGTKTDFATGVNPISVAIRDVNGNGRPDLVVANYNSSTVSVLLGTGTGSFGAKTDFATGTNPYAVAIGDVNGDGRPDLATANFTSNNVSVLLGTGTGSFGAKTDFATGTNPYAVAIGDVNGDGRLDIAVANGVPNTVSVLLGNGTGGFTNSTGSPFATGSFPRSIAIADMNGDGKPDLVTANFSSDNVSVLLGNGEGSFGARTDFATRATGTPVSVATGDLNGDGAPDIVASNFSSASLSVLLSTSRTRTTLAVAPASIIQGYPFTLTANVSPAPPGSGTPTDSVSFFDGLTPIGRKPVVAGVATLLLNAPNLGQHMFTGVYRGDSRFFGSASAPKPGLVWPTSFLEAPPAAPLAFALEPLAPNPARGGIGRVTFTLPSAATARLDVVDVAGRRIDTRDVGALGAGRHSVDLAAGRAIAPGLYWVRLTQGAQQRVRRVAIVE